MSRLPRWRKITWSDLAPRGHVPEECVWPLRLVLAMLRDDPETWPARYLGAFPGEREVLRVYLACLDRRGLFTRACNRRHWSRATAYRVIDRALRIIALGLARDGVQTKLLNGTDRLAEHTIGHSGAQDTTEGSATPEPSR